MKYLIILSLLLIGCNSKQPNLISEVKNHKCPEPKIIVDTFYVHDTIIVEKEYNHLIGIINKKNDSLFVERYRLERVKFYNNIVKRNKTQLKFLSGWISRAVQ